MLKSSGSKMVGCLSLMRILEYDWWKIMTYIVFQIGLHMHTVPQNKDKFTIDYIFYCCKALLFTQSSICEFLCGLIFMSHPVKWQIQEGYMIISLPHWTGGGVQQAASWFLPPTVSLGLS